MKIQCPHCETKFKISEEHLGRNVKCSHCEKAFVVVAIPREKIYPKQVIHSRHEHNVAEFVQTLEQVLDKITNYDDEDIEVAQNMLRQAISKFGETFE